MRLHNFHLTAVSFVPENSVWNILLSYVQKGFAIVPQEGWQLALHFDL